MSVFKYLLISLMLLMPMVQQARAETIMIAGSTTVQKYIKLAIAAYEEMHPDINFNVSGSGSTSGFGQMLDKRIDIGMMSRELTEWERQSLDGVQFIAVAKDAVVPVVSREVGQSGVSELAIEALRAIYRGEITNWKQLGGNNRKILLVDKEMHRGTRFVFANYVLGSPDVPVASGAITLESNDDVSRVVTSSDQAIAYVSISYVDESIHALSLLVDGDVIAPSRENIKRGRYPLSRTLYLLVSKTPSMHVQDFLQFILSDRGQKIAEDAGYLSIK